MNIQNNIKYFFYKVFNLNEIILNNNIKIKSSIRIITFIYTRFLLIYGNKHCVDLEKKRNYPNTTYT